MGAVGFYGAVIARWGVGFGGGWGARAKNGRVPILGFFPFGFAQGQNDVRGGAVVRRFSSEPARRKPPTP